MEPFVVHRYVNLFYYLCFLTYVLLTLIYLLPKRKEEPYKSAFRVFIATSLVLIAMEFFGTISGIRVFLIGGEMNITYQLSLQVIMGFGEGGAMAAMMFLMVDSVKEKNVKNYCLYLTSLSILMLTFASFTFIHGSA